MTSRTPGSTVNVIFPIKLTPINQVWSWSLGGQGQGVILTETCMFT